MHHINSSNDKRLAIGYVKIKQYNYELLSYIFDKFMLFLLDGSAWFQCIIQIIMIIILCLHSLLRLPYKNSTSTCSKITCYHTCSHVIWEHVHVEFLFWRIMPRCIFLLLVLSPLQFHVSEACNSLR